MTFVQKFKFFLVSFFIDDLNSPIPPTRAGSLLRVPAMSRSDWMLPGGSVFVKPLDRKAPGRSATQTMKDVEALNEFAPREPP